MEENFLDIGFLNDSEITQLFDEAKVVDQEDEVKEEEKEIKDEKEDFEINEKEDAEEKTPESVGNDSIIQEEEENTNNDEPGSPNTSSIAKAFQEIGVLQTLDDDKIGNIKTTEDLADALEEEVRNRLDEHHRMIDEALKYRMPVPRIQQYENTLSQLNAVTDDIIETEDEESENIRKSLIYQDLVLKGHSQDEAVELVEDYVENGKDIDKAKKALDNMKRYYSSAYEKERQDAKKAFEKQREESKKQYEQVKSSILEDEGIFKDLEINKSMRQKICDCILKPIETTEDGRQLTAIQKFMIEDPATFYKMTGMFYVLTDGFKKVDNLLKGPVKKEMKKGIESLNRVINSTPRNQDGTINLKSGVSANSDSFIDLSNYKLG